MSMVDRIRAQQAQDIAAETASDIYRSEAQSTSRADIIALENEMVPWLAQKRHAEQKARLRGEWDDTGGDTT